MPGRQECLVGRSAWSAGGRFLKGSARGSGCGDDRWYSQSCVNGEFDRPGRLVRMHKDWQPNVPRTWDVKSIRMRSMCMARGGRRWCAAHGPMTRVLETLRNTTSGHVQGHSCYLMVHVTLKLCPVSAFQEFDIPLVDRKPLDTKPNL